GIDRIFGIGGGLAVGGRVLRLQAVGNADFVEISVGGERQQTGVLIFPAEASDASLPRSFADGHENHLSADLAVAVAALFVGDVHDVGAGDGFDESVAEGIQGGTQSADVHAIGHGLLDFLVGGGTAGT